MLDVLMQAAYASEPSFNDDLAVKEFIMGHRTVLAFMRSSPEIARKVPNIVLRSNHAEQEFKMKYIRSRGDAEWHRIEEEIAKDIEKAKRDLINGGLEGA